MCLDFIFVAIEETSETRTDAAKRSCSYYISTSNFLLYIKKIDCDSY